MRKIIFYLSDHGFGHATRNLLIIEELLLLGHEVIVKTGEAQGEFIKKSLEKYEALEVITQSLDIGLVLKSSSFQIDGYQLEIDVQNYIESWSSQIRKEMRYLKDKKRDLVVSDIVPWIFHATKTVGIKSCLISNFTWIEIYQEYLSDKVIDAYKSCYQLVDEVIRYDLATSFMKDYFKQAKNVSVCARMFHEEEVQKIKKQFNQPIVFVSVGRSVDLEEAIDVEHLNYQFIVTEGIQLVGNNVLYLPKEIENTQDYIKAADLVITKAGFGTIAEVMLAKKKCGVIERETVAEDREMIRQLVERGLALQVEYEEGLDMEQILSKLEGFEPSYRTYSFTNDGNKIANLLINMCSPHYLITIPSYGNEQIGYLVPLDTEKIPFDIKRMFYLVDVPSQMTRGKHAYRKTKQVLICLHGTVKVKCSVDEKETIYELNDAKQGLYLEPRVWREAYDFSEGAVLLTVSSEVFDEADYRKLN